MHWAQRTVHLILIFVHVAFCDVNYENEELDKGRLVLTDKGVVRGHLAHDGDYMAFQGIPYAAPPIGEYRYKAPVPADHWNEIFEANRTVICPQQGTGDEDCLVINVFTPIEINNEKLPVLFFIHGGDFFLNLGPTDGVEHLVKKGLVVVTINYRLGVLGFLCLRNEDAPGNAGLKDQVKGLKWVQRNIANFGGDPEQVTVYGLSAGSISVELLMFSKYNSVLFHKAILESGSVINPWAIDEDPVHTANEFTSNIANINKNLKNESLIDLYRKIPVNNLTEANMRYYETITNGDVGFAPCIEQKLPGVEPFLTEDPVKILRNNEYKSIPIMSAFQTLEALWLKSNEFYPPLDFKDKIISKFEGFLPSDLVFDTNETKKAVAECIKNFYFGPEPNSDQILFGYLHFYGDQVILHGHLSSAAQYVKNNETIYLMEFRYKGGLGGFTRDPEPEFYWIEDAGHGDRSRHAFLEKPILCDQDRLAVERTTTLIANFVKYGNPTPSTSSLLPVLWPVTDRNLTYLLQDEDFRIDQCPYSVRMQLWDDVYQKYGRLDLPLCR